MMSFRPVLDDPASGVAVHGTPPLGGVLPLSKGDFGVRGVIEPGIEDCCGLRTGDAIALPRESSHPSSAGEPAGIESSLGVDMGLIAGEGPGERYDELISSSIENIISFEEAFALSEGRSSSALLAIAEPRLGFCEGE